MFGTGGLSQILMGRGNCRSRQPSHCKCISQVPITNCVLSYHKLGCAPGQDGIAWLSLMRFSMDRLADWAQALAAFGVLVGLILVAYELRQTQLLLELEARSQTYNNQFETRRVYLGENPSAVMAKACSDPQSLTLEDALILQQAFILAYSQIRMAKEVAARSGVGESGWVPIASVEFEILLRLEPARDWLREARPLLDQEIVAVAEKRLPPISQDCPSLQKLNSLPTVDET